jgi:hypothetical protein
MSNYIKLETGEIKSQGGWRSANKHMSLPRVWTADTLTDLELTAILAAPKPSCTDLQNVVGNGVTTDANGNTVEAWSVVDKFAKTTAKDGTVTTKAQHEKAHTASLVAAKEASVRTDRDSRIALTDWTALSDVTMAADMATYRQALRDITAHADFPDLETGDWPTKPEA